MRFEPSPSESLLWQALSARKLGVAFRRQVPVGRFIVDFLAPSVAMVVEVDGGYLTRRRAADARRDEKLRRWGFRVLRLDAELIMRDLSPALALITAELSDSRERPIAPPL